MSMNLPADVIGAIQAHAIAEWPRESCGLVLRDEAGALQYLRCRNVNANPEAEFEIAAEHWMGRIAAVIHSHPHRPQDNKPAQDWPSAADMRGQIESGLVWGIVVSDGENCTAPFFWGDALEPAPLIGRPFRHGVWDCYVEIRDAFRIGPVGMAAQGFTGWPHPPVRLPDFPRGGEWWNEGDDLYCRHFAEAGFERVSEPVYGDVFLMQINSPVSNHGGVVLDRGLILHHPQSLLQRTPSLSRAEPMGRWRKYVTHWLRYTGAVGGEG
jgi:proteasome lid subunit RPN8/RPN11